MTGGEVHERGAAGRPTWMSSSNDSIVSVEWSKSDTEEHSIEECTVFRSSDPHSLPPSPRHPVPPLLFVLAHGLFGSSNDFDKLREYAVASFPEAIVLVSTTNTPSTTSGVRNGGTRLAVEIVNRMLREVGSPVTVSEEAHRDPVIFYRDVEAARSILREHQQSHEAERPYMIGIGHSLGGLYMRYALGLLYKAHFFHEKDGPIIPFEYMSISTPHLGSRRPAECSDIIAWILKYLMVASVMSQVQTMKDLTLEDDPEHPVLLEMSEPNSPYYKALRLFICTAISTTHYDKIVPFPSSAILLRHPFPPPEGNTFLVAGASGFHSLQEEELRQHSDPTHFLCKRTLSTEALDQMEHLQENDLDFIVDVDGLVELQPALYENLRSLPWRRIHIQFPLGNTIETLLTHQTPLAKGFNRHLGSLFRVNVRQKEAETFLQLLVRIISLDVATEMGRVPCRR